MDRNSLLRWILIAAVLLGGYYLFFGRKSGTVQQQLPQETYEKAPGFAPDAIDVQPGQPAPAPPPAGDICTIRGDRFEADLTTRGAGLTHFRLTDDRYARSAAADMSTTPDHERWHNLRTDFRAGVADDQVKYDQMDWQLERLGDKGCKFAYQDDAVSIVKTVTTDERPFELKVETTITNLTDAPKTHEAKIEAFAWRTNAEVKGHLGRVSPFQTDLECARGDDVKRLQKDAKEFDGGWYGEPLADRYAAIDNYYFGQAL